IAGLRKSAGGGEAGNLSEAKPMAVAPSNPSHNGAGYPDATTTSQLQNGLKLSRMWYKVGAVETDIGAVAFVNSLSQFASTGAGQVDVVPLVGTAPNATKPDTAELINSD